MYSFRYKKGIIFVASLFIFSSLKVISAYTLIIPPDPFDSTDRFVSLTSTLDGTITRVQSKIKAPGSDPIVTGELWGLLRYKLPTSSVNNTFHFAASKVVHIQGLSNDIPILLEFDFSDEPMEFIRIK